MTAIQNNEPHVWGFLPPSDTPEDALWWSARAIFTKQGGRIDVVSDRQTFNRYADNEDVRRGEMAKWIMDMIDSINTNGLYPQHARIVTLEGEKYSLLYDTRGSHGYLYFVAWENSNGLSEKNTGLEQTPVG
jgi:hypothetical protein